MLTPVAPAFTAKSHAASASRYTPAADFSACALDAVPSTIRFLIPWTIPVSRKRLYEKYQLRSGTPSRPVAAQ